MRNVIKKVLKEEITSKCVDVVINKPHTEACSVFNGKLGGLCQKFNELRYLLSDANGLDMQATVDEALDPYKTDIPDELKQKFIEGLRLLYKTGKYRRDYIVRIKEIIDESRLIYKDGEWHYVNKLNTNYSDLAEILTCYLYDMRRSELNTIIDLFEKQNPRQVIKYIEPLMGDFKDYFSLDEMMTFTRNSTKNSERGEIAENMVNEFLKENGITINYEGGNGDMLDMKFGIDTIADMKLIQTKASIGSVNRIRNQIDWIGVANEFQGVGIYDRRSGQIVTYKGKRLCDGTFCNKVIPKEQL
jgi:hypothetical protein